MACLASFRRRLPIAAAGAQCLGPDDLEVPLVRMQAVGAGRAQVPAQPRHPNLPDRSSGILPRYAMRAMIILSLACLVGGCGSLPAVEAGPRLVVEDRVLHRLSPGLFGQFLERPSWGERGVEAAVDPESGKLDPRVKARLRDLRAPLLRFPGGTDVDYLDWRDMVDGVPGRAGTRPVSRGHRGDAVTNRFGYDEFLRLCEELGAAPLLVVNLGDALLGRKPLAEAARTAAALVAYVNAAPDAALPPVLAQWPALRARNGRAQPYAVRFVQIGNEAAFLLGRLRERNVADPEGRYVEALAAYAEAIRAVDPQIAIVVDAVSDAVAARIHERLGAQVQYLAQHHYLPWAMRSAMREGGGVPPSRLSAEQVWYAWVAIPGSFGEQGESVLTDPALRGARRFGYRAAVTEWNWNGFWALAEGEPPLDAGLAKAVGAAGYLHAFLRAGDVLELACQSIAVGERWGIAAIRVDPSGRVPPHFHPGGLLSAFYARYRGDELLASAAMNVPTYDQPLRLGAIAPAGRVALLDALATRSERALYVHAINRHYRDALGVTFDLRAFAGRMRRALLHAFEGRLDDAPRPGEAREAAWLRDQELVLERGEVRVSLPPRSVSIVEIELAR